MPQHDVQQVCLNGHQATDSYYSSPEFRKNFCAKCGEKTIIECPNCNTPIKGDYKVEGVFVVGTTPVPTHCEGCGKPYPWTAKKKANVASLQNISEVDYFKLVYQICSRFHLVAKQLKSRYSDRETLIINDEYDTQDLLHSLLHIYFEDIRPEEWTPSYAGGCSRVDFLLKKEEIIIEVKKQEKH